MMHGQQNIKFISTGLPAVKKPFLSFVLDVGVRWGGPRPVLRISEQENIFNHCQKFNSGSSDAQAVTTCLNPVMKGAKYLHFRLSFWYSESFGRLVSNLQQIERKRAEICVCLESRNRMARTGRWRFKELVK
jgi:hypothetical protein